MAGVEHTMKALTEEAVGKIRENIQVTQARHLVTENASRPTSTTTGRRR